jgi:urease accessory protein
MKSAHAVKTAGHWYSAGAIDCVTLDAHGRHRRRIVLTGERGTTFMLDLPHAIALRDGDGLLLDDGAMVRVAGHAEPLIEIAAADAHELARLAWHIGNRHVDVQIVGDRLRIRRDHVIEDMLRGLGARLSPVEAPFDPEQGAYGQHSHGHDHAHGYDHARDDEHHRDDRRHHHHEPDHAHEHNHERDHDHG